MSGMQAINLMHMALPKATTIERIRAEANDDLLKNNKYSQGKKEYLDTNTLRRMLNEAFDYKWTWEVLSFETRNDGGTDYALVYGRLHLPGLGFRDAFGSAKIEAGKKDNSAIFASASSYAFKNAVKQTGFASNLFDENFEEELWFDERQFDKEDEEAQRAQAKAESKKDEQRDSRMIIQEESSVDEPVQRGSVDKQKLSKAEEEEKPKAEKKEVEEFTEEQKKDLADIRKDYGIKTQKQLIGFFQIWSKDIKTVEDITPRAVDDFFDFYDANADLFEDFAPEEVD